MFLSPSAAWNVLGHLAPLERLYCVLNKKVCKQVVVVSSGLNDWRTNPPMYSVDDWTSKAIAFLQKVSAAILPLSVSEIPEKL